MGDLESDFGTDTDVSEGVDGGTGTGAGERRGARVRSASSESRVTRWSGNTPVSSSLSPFIPVRRGGELVEVSSR